MVSMQHYLVCASRMVYLNRDQEGQPILWPRQFPDLSGLSMNKSRIGNRCTTISHVAALLLGGLRALFIDLHCIGSIAAVVSCDYLSVIDDSHSQDSLQSGSADSALCA